MKINLTNIKPIAILALIASILLIIIVAVLLVSANRRAKAPIYIPEPIPSINPQKLPQPQGFEVELRKIRGILPYEGTNFTIRYQSLTNMLSVEINAKTKDEFVQIRKDAESFIKGRGVTDICVLNIFWETPEGSTLYEDLTGEDILTTGCSAATQ